MFVSSSFTSPHDNASVGFGKNWKMVVCKYSWLFPFYHWTLCLSVSSLRLLLDLGFMKDFVEGKGISYHSFLSFCLEKSFYESKLASALIKSPLVDEGIDSLQLVKIQVNWPEHLIYHIKKIDSHSLFPPDSTWVSFGVSCTYYMNILHYIAWTLALAS